MNTKVIFAAAVICAAAALSGCSASEPAESKSSSSTQTQSVSSVKSEQSSTTSKSSSTTSSSTKSQWTRSTYTVPKLPSKSSSSTEVTPWTSSIPHSVPTLPSGSSSNAAPWTFPANPEQKRLGVTSDWADFLSFIFTPGAVVVAVDDKGNDLVEDDMSMYMIMKIPYDQIAESYFVIPINSPVMVYGSSAHARSAYSELIKLRPDIPEITCFVAA